MLRRAAAMAILAILIWSRPSWGEHLKLCYEDWPPFYSGNDAEGHGGVVIELVTEAARRAGDTLSFHSMPYARCLNGVEQGRYHGFPANSDEEALRSFGPVLAYWKIGFFVHDDWPKTNFSDLSEFKGKIVGLQAGYSSYGKTLDFHVNGGSGWIIDRAAELFNLRKVGARRIDTVIADVANAEAIIEAEKLRVRLLPPILDARAQRLMLAPEHAEVGERLGKALTALQAEGWFDGPYRRHLHKDWAAHEKEAKAVVGAM